jgi:N-acetylmuramoyl-L-alanine amidase
MTRTTDRSLAVRGQTIASRKNADLKARTALVNGTEDAILISIHQNIFPESQYRGAQVFYAPEGEGAALAERLQSAFATTINPGSNRKCKKAEGIYLMRHINCTGILVECGFLSNPEEELMLRTADYQKKICAVIAATTAEFLTK